MREHLAPFVARHSGKHAPCKIQYLVFAIPVRNLQERFQADKVRPLGDAASLADG